MTNTSDTSTPGGLELHCPACSRDFSPEAVAVGQACPRCQAVIPTSQLLGQLLDCWWQPRRWRSDLHRPSVPFLLEKLWTANGQGEALYKGIGPRHANYSIFRHMVTKVITRGLDEGWMELELPPDPLAEDPVYRLNFKDSERFGAEMERLFPEVNWDEPIDLPAPPAGNRATRRQQNRRGR